MKFNIKKNRKDKKEKVGRRKSRFGGAPYSVATKSSIIFIIVGVIFAFAPLIGFNLLPPTRVLDPWEMVKWTAVNSIIPHLVMFLMTYTACLFILSMGTKEYIWWLLKQSVAGALLTFMLFETVVCIFILGTVNTSPIENFSTNGNEASAVQNVLLSMASLFLIFPPWLGYRTSWRAYREIGAQTIDERWESHSQKLWVRNSGQVWDKLVESPWTRISGSDGKKPRGGFFWVLILSPIILSFAQAAAYLTSNNSIVGVVSITILPVIVTFIAARAKVKDGYQDSHHFLDIKRDETTEDDFATIA